MSSSSSTLPTNTSSSSPTLPNNPSSSSKGATTTSGIAWTVPDHTRVVTIAAHVDAGKTTLADQLCEHNGIISERAAGRDRYLDSDPEEQRRGITMRSSAIGLRYDYTTPKKNTATATTPMIVHVVDSPGHTDFLREVSSSMVACDSALLLLDAVEGMTARTHQVFRETARHGLVPLLIINKVDRYYTDLHLSATDAYVRLRSLLESVNAATAAMVASMEHDDDTEQSNNSTSRRETLEQQWTFDPSVGNVVFASALHGWGFTVPGLARHLFRTTHGHVKPMVLKHYLFGDYMYKNGKWRQWKQQSSEQAPLFAELALQPLWDIYQGVETALQQTSARLSVSTPGMDTVVQILSPYINVDAVLQKAGRGEYWSCLLRRYRPLGDALLHTICEYCPSPKQQAAIRYHQTTTSTGVPDSNDDADMLSLQTAMQTCAVGDPTDNESTTPVVAHICKFFLTDRASVRDPDLPHAATASDENSSNNTPKVMLGLARVLCGTLVSGHSYHVMAGQQQQQQQQLRFYLLMGSSFCHVNSVPAGHLCAVYGLEAVGGAPTLTISSDSSCPSLSLQHDEHSTKPLVKVHIETVKNTEEDAQVLEQGLEQLKLVDAAVEVSTTDRGERLLACLGELHLEQTILDLKQTYCARQIDLRISDPIVEFAETTVWFQDVAEVSAHPEQAPRLRQTTIPPYREEEGIALAHHGRCRAVLPGRGGALQIRVLPLKASVFTALQNKAAVVDDDDCEEEVQIIARAFGMGELSCTDILAQLVRCTQSLHELSASALILSPGLEAGQWVRGVEAEEIYVPVKESNNASVVESKDNDDDDDKIQAPGYQEYSFLKELVYKGCSGSAPNAEASAKTDADCAALSIWNSAIRGSLIAGFETALRAGPVCEEPIRGVLVVVESIELTVKRNADDTATMMQPSKPIAGGMVVSAMRSGVRCALLSRPVRLVEAYLRLTLHTPLTGLGSLYEVLNKRRGKVLEDSMVDGTDLLLITALVPQAEAFGLAPELFRKTSGEVTAPEMLFSHWERLDVDPFWVPTSDEEREDFGELQNVGDSSTGIDNTALSYIRLVRKRKGLAVDSSRTITNAEKQRTLKR